MSLRLTARAVLLLLILPAVQAHGQEITRKNIRFVEYPDFPEAHSTWGSIGYSPTWDRVYIGVTNHRDKVGLFEYGVPSGEMRLLGFLPELANLRPWQWQGKIHSQIVEGPDSCMYFSTDGGETRMLYLMNHPRGYAGSYFFRWDPSAGRLDRLGSGPRYDSLKDLMVSRRTGLLMSTTFPQVRLLLYDHRENDLRDLGRVGSAHVPRVLFSDRYDNLYYVDWRQRLIKYEPATGELLFSEKALPAFPGTGGYSIITGITAWAENPDNGAIYFITYGSKLVEFHPRRRGIGEWKDLGGIYDDPEREPWGYYCPNMAMGANDRLYYFIGGHGNYAVRDTTLLMEFDPASGEKRKVLSFPLEEISEVTGANVSDSRGNLYFAGRRRDEQAELMGESGASRPFMIIFNPLEELK